MVIIMGTEPKYIETPKWGMFPLSEILQELEAHKTVKPRIEAQFEPLLYPTYRSLKQLQRA